MAARSAGMPGPARTRSSARSCTCPQLAQLICWEISPPQGACVYRIGGPSGAAHRSPHSVERDDDRHEFTTLVGE